MELDMNGLSQIMYGHAAFQYLAAACDLRLLDGLAEAGPSMKPEIRARLGLAERATDKLLLGCTGLGLTVQRDGRYRVADVVTELMATRDCSRFTDVVAFYQHIVYVPETDFTKSLRQNRNVGLRRIPGFGRWVSSSLRPLSRSAPTLAPLVAGAVRRGTGATMRRRGKASTATTVSGRRWPNRWPSDGLRVVDDRRCSHPACTVGLPTQHGG